MITLRDTQLLLSLARYYTLTRAQINRLHFPEDRNGRLTRRRLQLLVDAKLIHRTNMQVVNPAQGAPAPVYYPSREGCAFVAQEFGPDAVRGACWQLPNWQSLYHIVQVADTHILFDQSVARYPGVCIPEWYSESSILNPEEQLREKRYTLYTRLTERIVCVPDAGLILEKAGHRKVFYLEQDRDTTQNAERVAARKHAGYQLLAERSGHRKHFPSATVRDFSVLMVAPSMRRRDALRRAFSRTSGSALWRFASLSELTAETLLMRPMWHACDGTVAPLLKPAEGAS